MHAEIADVIALSSGNNKPGCDDPSQQLAPSEASGRARQSWSLMTHWLGFDALVKFSLRAATKSRHARILARRCRCLRRILNGSIWSSRTCRCQASMESSWRQNS